MMGGIFGASWLVDFGAEFGFGWWACRAVYWCWCMVYVHDVDGQAGQYMGNASWGFFVFILIPPELATQPAGSGTHASAYIISLHNSPQHFPEHMIWTTLSRHFPGQTTHPLLAQYHMHAPPLLNSPSNFPWKLGLAKTKSVGLFYVIKTMYIFKAHNF